MGGYSIPVLLQRSVSIFLLPVYTHFLRPKDYGVLDLLDLFGNIVGALIGLRLGQALFYFYFHAEDKDDRSRFVTSALAGAFALGLGTGGIGFPLARAISGLVIGDSSYAGLFRIFFVSFAASLPLEFGFCYLRVRERSRAFTVISVVRLIAYVILNVLFLAVFHLGAASMLWSVLLVNVSLSAVVTSMVLAENRLRPSRRHFIEMIRYSAPLGISSVGELGLNFGDRFFLRPNVSLSLLGIYGLAYKIGMLVTYASIPFFTYWNSQMVGLVKRPNGEQLYARVATYLLAGLTYLALLVTVFARPALTIAVAPDYRQAAILIPWVALAYVLRGMGSYLVNSLLIEKRSADVARITWIGAGACIAGYAVLIPHFKLWGAVAATLIGFLTIFAVGLWKSQRVRPFRYEYDRWMKVFLAAAIVLVPYETLRPETFWLQVVAGITAAVLFPLILVALRFPGQQERRIVKDGFTTLAARLRVGVV